MKNSLSDFEKVFGEGSCDLDEVSLIAIIRDSFDKEINHYIPESSMLSSPRCVLFAIYKLLENDLKDKDFISFEETI